VNPALRTNGGCELDMVIGKDFLITVHYQAFPPLEKIIKNLSNGNLIIEKHFQHHAGFLAYKILKELYAFSLGKLDQIYIKINKIEEQLFDGNEKASVKQISILKRDILDFRRTIYPHHSVLTSFEENGKKFFGKDFDHYSNFLLGEYAKLKNLIENGREILDTLHQTNESLLTTKTNEIIKILTIMAFATFPLMLLSSLFGMNTLYTPVVGSKGDFWIIIGAMMIGTAAMFLFFKRKKWL
jgi:magnesium transporter